MRARVATTVVAMGVLVVSTAAARSEQLTRAASPRSHALVLLADIVHGRDRAVTAWFNTQMRARLTSAQLAHAWVTYQSVFGRYRSHGNAHVTLQGQYTIVQVPLRMERRPGEFRITFQSDGKVAGLYFLRTGVPL